MNLKDQRAATLKAAQDIVAKAKAEDRDLTPEEVSEIETKSAEVVAFDVRIKAADDGQAAIKALAALPVGHTDKVADQGDGAEAAKSLGEHFVKHTHETLLKARGNGTFTVAAPEFVKAATDSQVTTGAVWTPYLTEFDRTIVQGVRRRLTIADLLGSGTISGNAVQYLVEGALEGAFTTVAEGGAKPQIHVADPTAVVDALRKIAAFIKFTDEMLEDLPFVVSEINTRLMFELGLFEENLLLNGTGTGSQFYGIMTRAGTQTEARGNLASNDTVADTIFRAITKVQTGSGLDADGIVIHPSDYQALRLTKDANGQYFGGGFFNGAYGNGGISDQPNVWGLRTVVTPAVSVGTVLVGAFAQSATVYRKGGIRVESTNSHASDFTNNLVTVRAEERIALAMRRPTGFVKTTITVAP